MRHDARISALLAELSVHERLTYLCYSLTVDAPELTIENLIDVAGIMARRLPNDQRTRVIFHLNEIASELHGTWN